METPLDSEAVLSSLKELAAERHQKIPQILEDYLLHVARTGNVVFENEWADVKRLLKLKLDCNIDYFQHFCSDLPTDKDFSLHHSRTFLYDRFDFFSRPPFTVQRLVEVLTTSRRQYRRIDKYLRAVEKNLMVVSTFGQEAEFSCESKFAPRLNYASPTVSKVGQADLIPLQNAAMDYDVRSRLSMRIFNPALNSLNGDESDDEEENDDGEEEFAQGPFVHPAIEGATPVEGAENGASPDSPTRKNLLRKRKLRPTHEQTSPPSQSPSSSKDHSLTSEEPQDAPMEESASKIVKESEPESMNTNEVESEKPAEETPMSVEPVAAEVAESKEEPAPAVEEAPKELPLEKEPVEKVEVSEETEAEKEPIVPDVQGDVNKTETNLKGENVTDEVTEERKDNVEMECDVTPEPKIEVEKSEEPKEAEMSVEQETSETPSS